MRLVGCQRGLLALVGVLVAGCFEESPEQRSNAVCTAYCECYVTAGEIEQCVGECLPEVPSVSDECLDCVISNSQTCSLLDDLCTDLCIDTSTP